jgi:hypothetical protein
MSKTILEAFDDFHEAVNKLKKEIKKSLMKKEITEIICPNCNYKGPAKSGNDGCLLAIAIVLAIVLFPIGLIAPVVYYLLTNKLRCPKCQWKHVRRK